MYAAYVVRVLFLIGAFCAGLGVAAAFPDLRLNNWFAVLTAALAACLVVVEIVFQKRYLETLVALFFGLVLGLIASSVIFRLLELLIPHYYDKAVQPLIPIVLLFLCYVTISIVMQTKDRMRFVVPYVDFSHQGRKRGGYVLDSSVLVDGRMIELSRTPLLDGDFVVPRFVLNELQTLADSAEALKRARGRRGLDAVGRLRANPRVILRIEETDYPSLPGVDQKLLRLVRAGDGVLCTADFNLTKIARIENIEVLALQEIAAAMRPSVMPGETAVIEITRPGEERGQGVGFLEDGTMVVVENSRSLVGRRVAVEVVRFLTTAGGRIVFAKPLHENSYGNKEGGVKNVE
jgi:uncharacterized protein YacL